MPAYHESSLGERATDRLERALEATRTGHAGTAEAILESLLVGPFALQPMTVAIRLCSHEEQELYLGHELWLCHDAHPDEAATVTHGMCLPCCVRFEAKIRAQENAA
jgi:hypothetical protein